MRGKENVKTFYYYIYNIYIIYIIITFVRRRRNLFQKTVITVICNTVMPLPANLPSPMDFRHTTGALVCR